MERERRKNFIFSSLSFLTAGRFFRKIFNFSEKTTQKEIYVKIIKQEDLTAAQKGEMWRVYKNYYYYSRSYFMKRLPQNTHFSLYLNNGKIGGFTGLRINKFRVGKRNHFLIYFGQTVISYHLRGQSLIPTTGIKLLMKYWKELLTFNSWFWFDALSYKAYLVPAKALSEYFPCYYRETPQQTKSLMDTVGSYYYADSYCPHTGTVRKQANYINDMTTKIYKDDLKDKAIAFFAKANPGYDKGQGLLTIAPINLVNIKRLIKRFVKRNLGFQHKPHFKRNSPKKLQPVLNPRNTN